MTLYRQYRPQDFSELRGQEHVVEVLQSSLMKDKASHAYLFTGPRGTGKTSTARILGRALNCTDLKNHGPCNSCEACHAALEERLTDFIEIDAASHGLVDDARALVEQAKFMPSQVRKKVYIIDEVHMLSKSAFNALLKIIEEPPDHVHFIMATTEAHKVLETIKSRCQRFDFHLSDEESLAVMMKEVAGKEKFTLEEAALSLLAKHARGSYRDALSLLEQFTGMKSVAEEDVRNILGLSDSEMTMSFVDDLLALKTTECLLIISESLREGHDPYQFCQAVLGEMRERLLSEKSQDMPLEWIENFYAALEKLRSPLLPELPLELAVYRCHRGEQLKIINSKVTMGAGEAKEKMDLSAPVETEKNVNNDSVSQEQVVLEKLKAEYSGKETKATGPTEVEVKKEDSKSEKKATVTGSFSEQDFIKSIEQASLRTLVKYSQLSFEGTDLRIDAKSDFEVKKMKSHENFSYLLGLLETHLGTRASITFSVQEKPAASDGLSSTDLESVF
jgi:DNA polymerase III subunit gamma/tau